MVERYIILALVHALLGRGEAVCSLLPKARDRLPEARVYNPHPT